MLGRKKTHPAPALKGGVYELTPKSSATFLPNFVLCAPDDFAELWRLGEQVPPSPNPMNPGTTIRRRQATFGASYSFGPQTSKCIGPISEAPVLVQRCVAAAKQCAVERDVGPEKYAVAHCNWYDGGKAALGFHQDNEPSMTKGLGIYSFTFLDGGPAYRYFTVSKDRAGKEVVGEFPLPHRSCLVMEGAFQEELYHGVAGTTRKAFAGQHRVNITVRAWEQPRDGVGRKRKADDCFDPGVAHAP